MPKKSLAHQIKRLEGLSQDIHSNIKKMESQRQGLSKKIKSAERKKWEIDQEVRNLLDNNKGPVVTEHAMLRYLERIKGIDLIDLNSSILPDTVKEQIKVLGNGTYPINKKFKIVVKDRQVVTVIPMDKNNGE